MSDDYLLSALAGVSKGVSNVLVPYFERQTRLAEQERKLRAEKELKEQELYIDVPELKFGEDVTIPAGKYRKEVLNLLAPQYVAEKGTGERQYIQTGRGAVSVGVPPLKDDEVEGKSGAPSFGDKSDLELKKIHTRALSNQLPELKQSADKQKLNLESLNKAKSLIDKGVTGKAGQLKAYLSQYPEFTGEDVEKLTDAQRFQLLVRTVTAGMRLDLVGSGQVSNWEQQFLDKMSAGGGTAKGAAKELLDIYTGLAKSKIANYNDTLSGATKISPDFGIIYKPIKFDENGSMNKDGGGVPKVKTGSADEILKKYGITE